MADQFNKDYFYNPERDDPYISDSLREAGCVRDYTQVHDADDLAQWRGTHIPSCRVCPRQRYCYVSHQMQMAKPKVIV